MLSVEGLSKRLGAFALSDVSFEVPAGAYVVLLGASGAGKTVLLEMIAGLARPDRGRVRLDGRDITTERIQRRGIGLVYQERALFPHMTVRRNLAYGLPHVAGGAERMRRLARDIGVEHLWERMPGTLSGGEAQRVALARTLVTAPRVLLLDEPLASLDRPARLELRGLLRRIHQGGQTIVHVTHDAEEALALATHLAVLEGGRLVQWGAPDEVVAHPRSPYIARFMGVRNVFEGTVTQGQLRVGDLAFEWAEAPSTARAAAWLRGEDVRVFAERPAMAWDNRFSGRVMDVEPQTTGELYVCVDMGLSIWAHVPAESADAWRAALGRPAWIAFDRAALRQMNHCVEEGV